MERSILSSDELHLTLKQRTLSYFAGNWCQCLATDLHLRYCRRCLLLGFHSPFYQIAGLVKCPIHREMLRSNCAQCGVATPRYAICPESFDEPFICGHCKLAIAGEIDVALFWQEASFQRAAQETLEPLASWLPRLSRQSAVYTGRGHEFKHVLEVQALLSPEEFDDARETAFVVAHSMHPCPLDKELIYTLKGALRTIPLSFRSPPPQASQPTGNRGRSAVCKSIRRHIERTYLRDHRRCLRHVDEEMGGTIDLGNCIAEVDPEACPIAQAAALWYRRAQWTGTLSANWDCGPNWDSILQLSADEYSTDADHKQWAWKLLLGFYGCCVIALRAADIGHFILAADDPDDRYAARANSSGLLWRHLEVRNLRNYQDARFWDNGALGLSSRVADQCLRESQWCARYARLEPFQHWKLRNWFPRGYSLNHVNLRVHRAVASRDPPNMSYQFVSRHTKI